MNVDIIFKIAGVGIVIAVVNQILAKNGRDDMASLVTIAGVVLVLLIVIDMIADLFATVKTVFQLY